MTSVVFSPDGQQLVSGGYDQTIRLWDARTGKLQRTVHGAQGVVGSLAFSPQGHEFAVATTTGLHVWTIAPSSELRNTLSIYHFISGARAWWKAGVSTAPQWTGDAWRWLGWRVRNPTTRAIERYPIESFQALLFSEERSSQISARWVRA